MFDSGNSYLYLDFLSPYKEPTDGTAIYTPKRSQKIKNKKRNKKRKRGTGR